MPLPIPQIRPISDLRTNLNDVCELARESQQPIFMTKNGKAEPRGYRLRSVRRAAATRTLCAETPRSRNRGEISIGIAHETGNRRFHRAPFRTLGRLDACSPLPSSRCIRFRIDSDLSRRGAESPEISPQSLRFNRRSIDHLCETPELGRPFADERLSHQGYRSWLVSPYRIFYSFNSENLIVWRIIHTRQDIDDFAFIDIDD